MNRVPMKIRDVMAKIDVGHLLIVAGIIITILILVLFGSEDVYAKGLEFNPRLVKRATFNIYPQVTDHSLEQVEVFREAWRISGDKDFLLTLKAENGTVDPMRRSNVIGKNGHYDWGICQLNYQWHGKFIDSPEFKETTKQLEYCWGVFEKRHGAFYGYYTRMKQARFFTFKPQL